MGGLLLLGLVPCPQELSLWIRPTKQRAELTSKDRFTTTFGYLDPSMPVYLCTFLHDNAINALFHVRQFWVQILTVVMERVLSEIWCYWGLAQVCHTRAFMVYPKLSLTLSAIISHSFHEILDARYYILSMNRACTFMPISLCSFKPSLEDPSSFVCLANYWYYKAHSPVGVIHKQKPPHPSLGSPLLSPWFTSFATLDYCY